jgi:hypothetical protein
MQINPKMECIICHSTRCHKVNGEGICAGCATAIKIRDKKDATKQRRMQIRIQKGNPI